MKKSITLSFVFIIIAGMFAACAVEVQPPSSSNNASPTPGANDATIALPALDALFSDKMFTAALKSKIALTDEQVAAVKKISNEESAKLKSTSGANDAATQEASARAIKSIRDLLGAEKTDQLLALAMERQSEKPEPATTKDSEPTMLKGPNAVPQDTRIVVNIPAFRMDIFREGSLLKSYKIGIGYQEFPLPTGFRKAEMIIFNPTWTQPNESWASDPGAITPAGAAGNPLGPIKVPIGGANLIHGGKALAKIGTFASHGCVGLTNDEVKDFAKVLAQATNTELTDETIAAFLKNKTRTRVVKFTKPVPVELRYETIVIQDGQLHVYRDVYNKNTNTEENLRAAFEADGISFEKLSEDEKTRALEAVNAMSLHPKKQPAPKPTPAPRNQNSTDRKAAAEARRVEAQRQGKLRNQKEIVIDIAELQGKGYPAPKDLHTGAGTVASNAGAPPLKPKPRTSPTPALQSIPQAGQPPRSTASPQ